MLNEKIKSLNALKNIILRLKKQGKKIVFTNGCFDLLHYGHVKYLEDAKNKGDILIVALNSDSSVRKIKGNKRPILSQNDRLGIIAGLESVDYVVLFNAETPLKTIEELKPDILVKGADWDRDNIVGSDSVKRSGGKVCTIKFMKGRSTTGLIKKIAKRFPKNSG
jgi:D-beta-D-heptose 7-phosphate kinase/D-beta-D-heptose 1-phosphate adenosyltransferase